MMKKQIAQLLILATYTSNASSVLAAMGPQDSMDHPTQNNLPIQLTQR